MKKTILFFAIALFAFAFKSDAQNYQSAVGARLGVPLSASFKYFLNESHALEGYVGTRGNSVFRWTNISGAYLIHNPINSVEGLQYYYGGGLSVYFWSFDGFVNENETTTTFGAQGYLGLDYTFADVPITLTADWVPTIFFSGFDSGFGGNYAAFGVRYILSR